MNRRGWIFGLAVLCAATTSAAEEKFSQAIRPDDFRAAGLSKLSPVEIARLDALVRDYQAATMSPAPAAVGPETPATPPAVVSGAKSSKPTETASRGLWSRAKVVLMPGTEIEYSTIESRIAGEFRGWQPRTVFTLENGQRWQVSGGDSYVLPTPMLNPPAKISPGLLGSFWLTIEGVKSRAKVVFVGGPK